MPAPEACGGFRGFEADQVARAAHEQGNAQVSFRKAVLPRNREQQGFVGGGRDIVKDKIDVGPRFQKLDRIVAMRAVRVKEDMKPPVMLPGGRTRRQRRDVRRNLECREGLAEHDGECDAESEGRQWCKAEHSISGSNCTGLRDEQNPTYKPQLPWG
jgi:hypothetical protein